MTQQETAEFLQRELTAVFPENFVSAFVRTILGQSNIYIRFAKGKDRSQWSNGIIENDPAYMLFSIDLEKCGNAYIEKPTTHFSALKHRGLKWRVIRKPSELEAAQALVAWFVKNAEALKDME